MLYLEDNKIIADWIRLYRIIEQIEIDAIHSIADRIVTSIDELNGSFFKQLIYMCFSAEYQRQLSKTRRRAAVALRKRILMQPHLLEYTETTSIITWPNDISQDEKMYLARFTVAAQELERLFSGWQNQGLYLAVGALIENSCVIYKTGGDPSRATRRRLEIYCAVTGIFPSHRKKRTTSEVEEKQNIPMKRKGGTRKQKAPILEQIKVKEEEKFLSLENVTYNDFFVRISPPRSPCADDDLLLCASPMVIDSSLIESASHPWDDNIDTDIDSLINYSDCNNSCCWLSNNSANNTSSCCTTDDESGGLVPRMSSVSLSSSTAQIASSFSSLMLGDEEGRESFISDDTTKSLESGDEMKKMIVVGEGGGNTSSETTKMMDTCSSCHHQWDVKEIDIMKLPSNNNHRELTAAQRALLYDSEEGEE